MDFDQQINEIVRESFKTTKKYIWKGVFTFLFYFAALYTLKDGVLPIMAQTFPTREDNNTTTVKMPSVDVSTPEVNLLEDITADSGDLDNLNEDDSVESGERILESQPIPEEKPQKELSEFEKKLDLEKHGYTPNVFHILFPIFGISYHQ